MTAGETPVRCPRIAIVGIGCLFPKAAGPGFFWANVKNGIDGIGPVPSTHWNPADYFDADPKAPDRTYARRGGFLSAVDFNPLEFGIPPKDLEATDTTQLLGLVAAKQALNDAGVKFRDAGGAGVDRGRVSVILGVTGTLELVIPLGARLGHPKWRAALKDAGVADEVAQDVVDRIADSYVPWQENSFPGLLGNVVAGRIANKLDLQGTNCVVDAACASSLSAVHLAALELQTGKADVVVTGGADTFNDIFMFMCFSKTPALSASGDARPFDAEGDGTILGEGLGMVVLKRLDDAERDGDRVYAVLTGVGSSSDGKGTAIYTPVADGQRRCLRNAYAAAGVTPESIELVEAHGTGTKVGDATEARALTDVFRDDAKSPPRAPWCALGSVKSMIGHTKSAAGAASLIKVALALYNKVLPPTLKVTAPVEPLAAGDSPFYVNTAMRPWLPRPQHPRRAALSAFGFGGSNFHAVLEEHQPKKTAPDWDGTVEICALTGDTPAAIAARLATLPTDWNEFARTAEASRQAFGIDASCRLVLVAHREATDLPKLIRNAAAQLERPEAAWQTPDGAYFGRGPAAGSLAVLFPGQGSQSVGMLRDLACVFPELLDTLSIANAAFGEKDGRRLSEILYPPKSFAADAKEAEDAALRATDAAQPAIGAVSYGAWLALAHRFGLTADAFAGHSYGELPALAAAGRLGLADLFALTCLRGRLMATPLAGDAGTMLAVFAPPADLEPLIAELGSDVVIANRNGPKQTVVSGSTAGIDLLAEALTDRGIRVARLSVAAAFHSPFVAAAAEPFRAALDAVPFHPAVVPVYANTTAQAYPADPADARELLGHQLAKPVQFADEIETLVAAGIRTFVEVGPGSVLTKLTEAILAGRGNSADFTIAALDASGGKRSGVLDFAHLLARLAARGHTVSLTGWEAGSLCRPAAVTAKAGLTVPLCGANYVQPRPVRPARPPLAATSPNRPVESPPMADPLPPDPLTQALLVAQQSLAALQQMQQQTAQLHKQFLESQDAAQRTLATLVAQQQALFSGAPVAVLPPAPLPLATFAPVEQPRTKAIPIPQPRAATPPPPVALPRAVAPAVAPPRPVVASTNGSHPAALGPAANHVAVTLLTVVSEKTGYPTEMLDLGMALDADLGIDSIKRVEILSALQEMLPEAPIVRPEHLGTLLTLQDVANFLSGSRLAESKLLPLPALDAPDDYIFHPAGELIASLPPASSLSTVSLAATSTEIPQVLLAVVSEKTGYPVEMLDLGMALDADLGIDSIKRVEILSALQEKLPEAPVVRPEHLGTLHTLQDVADFLHGSAPQTIKVAVAALPQPLGPVDSQAIELLTKSRVRPPISELTAPKTEQVSAFLPNRFGESSFAPPATTGVAAVVPPRLTEPRSNDSSRHAGPETVERSIVQAVDLDVATLRPRVPLPEGGEFWIVADEEPLTQELVAQLAALRYVPRVMPWPSVAHAKPGSTLVGLVLLAPARIPPGLPLNRLAFQWVQAAGPKLRTVARHSAAAAVIVSVARLDGAFGLANLAPTADPASGGLAGIVKTVRHEWPEIACKAIDLSPTLADTPTAGAAALVEEILAAGPMEVGISPTHRCTLELARTVRRTTGQAVNFGPKDVILVTGGGRGVTAETAVALAESFRATMVLTGRTAAPSGAEPAWAEGVTDEAALKAAAAASLGTDGTPKSVGDLAARITAQREIRSTLARIEATGAKAAYFPVNVSNGRSVADLLHQVKVKFGPVTGLIHGAGVLADRRIENLTPEQFDYVYSTKVDGARNLLDLLGGEDLKAAVLFSSTTARMGRAGQTAYAAANEVLNKTAQVEARKRPMARVVAVNWGPWDGGMVTPALRKIFETEGVGLIPLDDGATFLVQELNAAGRSVEVVALGAKTRPSGTISANGTNRGSGSNPSIPTPVPLHPPATNPPPDVSLAFERIVDVATHPILRSHVLDGRAVLPMAVHMEWLAHAALHGNPGLVFHGFNDLRITSGVMVEDGASSTLRMMAGRAVKQDAAKADKSYTVFTVPVEVRGRRRNGHEVIHSRAEVVLTAALPKPPAADTPPAVEPYDHAIEEVYKYVLFHGPDLHGIESVDGLTDTAFIGTAYPAPPPNEWFTAPLRSSWVADPLVLDASFQMMILWSFAQHGAGSLPCFMGRYRQFRRSFPAGPVKIVIRVHRDDGSFARADMDYLDADGLIVAQVQDYQCIIDPSLNQAFRRNTLGPAVRN